MSIRRPTQPLRISRQPGRERWTGQMKSFDHINGQDAKNLRRLLWSTMLTRQAAPSSTRHRPTYVGKWRTASFQIRDWWKDVIGEYRTRCRGGMVRLEAETRLKQVMVMLSQLLDPKAIEDSRRSCSDQRATLVTVELISK
ncbi:uncharacterized protein B0T23DRAFT_79439 [Neurospora hispaniola]|uniref:Uncharacterized protein n=1 Tax=Neurospora hispaniola TaxID=588809 RepID=A0AAJ0ICN8_9PEZI|nr:hypothetical protein B0T23DRAFT_79439 [Neurospora hispaniola]